VNPVPSERKGSRRFVCNPVENPILAILSLDRGRKRCWEFKGFHRILLAPCRANRGGKSGCPPQRNEEWLGTGASAPLPNLLN